MGAETRTQRQDIVYTSDTNIYIYITSPVALNISIARYTTAAFVEVTTNRAVSNTILPTRPKIPTCAASSSSSSGAIYLPNSSRGDNCIAEGDTNYDDRQEHRAHRTYIQIRETGVVPQVGEAREGLRINPTPLQRRLQGEFLSFRWKKKRNGWWSYACSTQQLSSNDGTACTCPLEQEYLQIPYQRWQHQMVKWRARPCSPFPTRHTGQRYPTRRGCT